MNTQIVAAIEAAAGVLVVAVLAWLTAILKANTDAITSHGTVLRGLARSAGQRIEGGAARPIAAAAGRPYPLWDQLRDPDPSGLQPGQGWNDCGEECCAEVVMHQHGVPVEADALRSLLRGPRGPALTTGQDLVRLLALCNVAAESQAPGADELPGALRTHTGAGLAVIVLGRWVSPTALHWVLCTRADAAGMSANDPWGGVRRSWTWEAAQAAYGGSLVVVTRSPDS